MSWTLSPEHLAARSQGSITRADLGSGNSTLEVFDATTPTPVRLAVIRLAKPCGTVVANRIRLAMADADGGFVDYDGMPAAVRWLAADGTLMAIGTVTANGAGGDMEIENSLGTAELYAGGRVKLKADHLIG